MGTMKVGVVFAALLPATAEWLTVIRGAGRTRVTQTFTDYRRFVSDVKIIEDAGPEN